MGFGLIFLCMALESSSIVTTVLVPVSEAVQEVSGILISVLITYIHQVSRKVESNACGFTQICMDFRGAPFFP